ARQKRRFVRGHPEGTRPLTLLFSGSFLEQIGSQAAILATLLPEIAARLGPPRAAYPLDPEQARYRLCNPSKPPF
ncbi:MAG TPA: hypothetical protein VFU22_05935, partial [Roseiflexaceae bacterium]|nr:hypothetical protein [Roseiflexaceae bacterium]